MVASLPSLTAVRAFEAAARYDSIAAAATELNVTPAAVTHQVRALERWLGVDLFIRKGSTLKLTPTGEAFFLASNRGIETIRAAAELIAAPDNRLRLAIVSSPSFAAQWLVPRLAGFRSKQKVELSVSTMPGFGERHWRSTDIGIVSGVETPSFLERRPFLTYRIIAVCSPRLLSGHNAIRSISDLKHHQLLHDEALHNSDGIDWSYWLRQAGHEEIDATAEIRFNNNFTAYRFAVDGHGVVLAKDILVQNELRRGDLVVPFNHSCEGKLTYDFVCSGINLRTKAVAQFWNWLQHEAEATNGCPIFPMVDPMTQVSVSGVQS